MNPTWPKLTARVRHSRAGGYPLPPRGEGRMGAREQVEVHCVNVLIAFNKPFDVLCQFTDGAGRRTLADFVTVKDVYPAGRLDYDSEGLVLLTDDGRLQRRIADPRHRMKKTYLAQVERFPDAKALALLRHGVELRDGITAPAGARVIDEPDWLWPRDPPIRYRRDIPTAWLELT